MRLTVDKIASVTRNLRLSKTLTLSDTVEAKHGTVVACKVLNDKSSYNLLEDVNGRMSVVQSGDILVGALGHRNALHGYEGVIPEEVKVGDTLNLLNLGGVIGKALSYHPEVGAPFQLEVMGQVLSYPEFGSRVGLPANVQDGALKREISATNTPVALIAGTCMNSGKTAAACSLVRTLFRSGLRVGGCKLTGVSLYRDVLSMRDFGAEWVFDFTDTGIVASSQESAALTGHTIFSELSNLGADVIVAETGDGIMGEYGVQAILADPDLMKRTAAFILCANDPAGVAGAIHDLQSKYQISVDVVTGPSTDNHVGTRFVESNYGIPAINARSKSSQLGELILEKVNKWRLEHSY